MKNPVNSLTPTDLQTIATATEAFVYGLPLVLVGLTKEQNTNYATPCGDGAPVNQICNKSSFPDYKDTQVVRPNCDTYYSLSFLDLTDEPMVLTIPPTGNYGDPNYNYYMMPLLDAYTNIIAGSPGTRTGETNGGNYIIAGEQQTVPAEYQNNDEFTILRSPTPLVWMLGRFQVNDPATDGQTVLALQDQLELMPLSAWGTTYDPPQGTVRFMTEGSPNDVVLNMSIADYFARLNDLLAKNPPPAADDEAMAQFATIGIGPNATTPFAAMEFSSAAIAAMNNIPKDTLNTLEKLSNVSTDEWNGLISPTIADYGTNYRQRAMVAYLGLGANPNADAVYYKGLIDSNGEQLNGSNCYCMTFPKGALPPCNPGAFWSLTLYNEAGYLADTPIPALGHNPAAAFHYEGDGSLKIYLQADAPTDTNYTNNWLPTLSGQIFNLMVRIYWPEDAAQETAANGGWQPPAVELQTDSI